MTPQELFNWLQEAARIEFPADLPHHFDVNLRRIKTAVWKVLPVAEKLAKDAERGRRQSQADIMLGLIMEEFSLPDTTAVTQEDLDALKGEDVSQVRWASTTDIRVAAKGCLPPPSPIEEIFAAGGAIVEGVTTDVKEVA